MRRSAEIALGPHDDEFLDLKDYTKNPHRLAFGWASNNSVFAELGDDYEKVAERIRANGEPGVIWLDNARAYGRTCDPADGRDAKVAGTNPCVTADTLVATTEGPQPVSSLVGRSFTALVHGLPFPSTGFRPTGIKDVFKLVLQNGIEVKAKAAHEIMTSKGWRPLGELKRGDSVEVDAPCRYSPVDYIAPLGREQVYDCSVPGVLRFVANGIVVHNCGEQSLESGELCCLAEVFPARCEDVEDFVASVRCALLYAKTVTLGATEWPEVNEVMLRNRRIGISLSGIAQFVAARGLNELREWCEAGYAAVREFDEELSARFAVPASIKLTSIKPSGTVSLLAGATPGVHLPESRYYLRRVRIAKDSDLIPALREGGVTLEDDAMGDTNTLVAAFPIDVGEGVKTLEDSTMWEQLCTAALLQKYWADNSVSCTVTFDPAAEGPYIAEALTHYQFQLKSVSFLPRVESGAYPQMPLEKIEREDYERAAAAMRPLNLVNRRETASTLGFEEEEMREVFCTGDRCTRA